MWSMRPGVVRMATRPLHVPYVTYRSWIRRVREAVLVIIAWTVIVLPCSSFREQPQDQGPRNVPRCDGPPSQGQGTFRGRFNGRRGLVYGYGLCDWGLFGWRPQPLHVPYVTYRSWIRRVREAVLVIIAWTVIVLPCSSFREQPQDQGPRNVPRCDGPR